MTSKVLTLTKSKSLSSVVPRKRTPSPEKNDEIVAEEMEPAVKKPKVELKASSFGLKRQYSTINISADKWLLTLDPESVKKLESPPSLTDGLDIETEKDLRYLGCEIIQSGAILLRLPQVAAATAQILYQRYFYQRSFVRHSWEYIAMGCLLLASKIEEAPRRPRDVINVFHRLEYLHGKRAESKEYVPMLLDSKYVNLKNQVIKAERKVLNVLGFVVHVNHPHKLIYAYLSALALLDNNELIQRAWSYMNDGLRTDIFLRYPPETIACACIFLAARTISKPVLLPQTPLPWCEAFDASDRDVRTISLILLEVYRRLRAPNWLRLNDVLNKIRGSSSATDVRNGELKNASSAAVAELERKRREIVAKADEMRRGRGASFEGRKLHSATHNSENKISPEKVKHHHHRRHHKGGKKRVKDSRQDYRTRDRRRSRSRDRSQSREEHQKSRSRDDRVGNYSRDEKQKSHSKERRRRSRSKEKRQRSRSREERRRILKDRISNQRERERDVYKALGKRPQGSESPERPSKQRR
ncbi:unnamed protein product [Enterobius vermicularis]|uniref:Cyclin-L1 n=1 Tax=Enterobius vermicularis TaxID=51028 RepID=A0A158Q958_ENTVE|nr:unnamed protein product [Enterobius vermicularis]